MRDWLYVGDHCAALRQVLAHGEPGETYNVGNSERTNGQIMRAVCALLDRLRPAPAGSHKRLITLAADRSGIQWMAFDGADKSYHALYSDRLEVLSSGSLPNSMTIEKMEIN